METALDGFSPMEFCKLSEKMVSVTTLPFWAKTAVFNPMKRVSKKRKRVDWVFFMVILGIGLLMLFVIYIVLPLCVHLQFKHIRSRVMSYRVKVLSFF